MYRRRFALLTLPQQFCSTVNSNVPLLSFNVIHWQRKAMWECMEEKIHLLSHRLGGGIPVVGESTMWCQRSREDSEWWKQGWATEASQHQVKGMRYEWDRARSEELVGGWEKKALFINAALLVLIEGGLADLMCHGRSVKEHDLQDHTLISCDRLFPDSVGPPNGWIWTEANRNLQQWL